MVLLVQDFDNVVFVEWELRTVRGFVPGEALVQNKVANCRTGGKGLKLVTVWMLLQYAMYNACTTTHGPHKLPEGEEGEEEEAVLSFILRRREHKHFWPHITHSDDTQFPALYYTQGMTTYIVHGTIEKSSCPWMRWRCNTQENVASDPPIEVYIYRHHRTL